MLDRAQIKENAKTAFKQAYWPSVGTFVLVMLIVFAAAMLNFIPLLGLAAVILLTPLSAGLAGYFLGIYRRDGDTGFGRAFSIAFSQNFGRKLGGILWMELWLFLWLLIAVIPMVVALMALAAYAIVISSASFNSAASLGFNGFSGGYLVLFYVIYFALCIPAFIKAFAYFCTPYILADCPNVTARNALKLSIRMTKGHKGKICVMGLSFIGWGLLTALTCGILGVFYTGPYMEAAFAGQYDELKRLALESGVIAPGELDGESAESATLIAPSQAP